MVGLRAGPVFLEVTAGHPCLGASDPLPCLSLPPADALPALRRPPWQGSALLQLPASLWGSPTALTHSPCPVLLALGGWGSQTGPSAG